MSWNTDWTVLLPLTAAAAIYVWGVRNVWRSAGVGRGLAARQCIAFAGALLALAAALVSPLDALSGELFAAHMVQHLLLILAAGPLLVLSDFHVALLWALPRRWSRALARRLYHSPLVSRSWQVITGPILAWLTFTIALWVWHAPALFEGALRDEKVHALEHLAFLVTAMLFWWGLFRHTRPSYVHYAIAVPYLFTSSLQSMALAALMTFSATPWYSYYAGLVTHFGLTPLEDQQAAGLVMWVPGGLVFTLLTIGYFAAWLGALEKRSAALQMKGHSD